MTTDETTPAQLRRFGDPAVLAQTFAGGTAYVDWEKALDGISAEQATLRPRGCPHSVAEVLGHTQYWLAWILASADGQPQPWPQHAEQGWPSVTAEQWEALKADFLRSVERAQELARDEAFIQQPSQRSDTWGKTLLAFSFHNAYHLGQLVLIRRMLGAWPPPGGGDTW